MTKTEVMEKIKEVAAAPNVYAGLKAKAEVYLADSENKEKAKALVEELKADVCTIDSVIALFDSPEGKKLVGEETAAKIAGHAKEVKAAGGKFCDCPACAPGKIVLDNSALIL